MGYANGAEYLGGHKERLCHAESLPLVLVPLTVVVLMVEVAESNYRVFALMRDGQASGGRCYERQS